MEQFNLFSIPDLISMTISSWMAVYLFFRNPFSPVIRSLALGLLLVSFYMLLGALQINLNLFSPYYTLSQKILIWTVTLQAPTWFYFTTTLLPKERQDKLKFWVLIAFLSGTILSILGAFTNLLFDYGLIDKNLGPLFYAIPGGSFYFILFFQVLVFGFWAVYNILYLFKGRRESEKKSLVILTLGVILLIGSGLFLAVNVLFFSKVFPEIFSEQLLLISMIFIAHPIISYSSHFDTGTSFFRKDFIISTLVILFLYVVFGSVFYILGFPYSFKFLLLIISLLLLIPITHVGYDWFMSWVRNIFYEKTLTIPQVSDGEVLTTLRNYNHHSNLEDSSLLRLKSLKKDGEEDKILALRKIFINSIEYLKPNDPEKRTKANLKYQILNMIADQVEEGQILWDLGFEEYPLGIAEKADGQKPRFVIQNLTDYQATSRNAFISLKKEAIHDLAWRISYLEKHTK